MILTDPDDFRIRNHDFSGPAPNCPVLVIEAVQNVKITIFPKRHHHVCPQERKRTPKELRASRSVTNHSIVIYLVSWFPWEPWGGRYGADVTVTDLPEVAPFLAEVVALNAAPHRQAPERKNRIISCRSFLFSFSSFFSFAGTQS